MKELIRPRRLRQSPLIRNLISETTLSLDNLVLPYFLSSDPKGQEPINGFTGVYRWGIETLSKKIESDLDRGLNSFLLFGSAPDSQKDPLGSLAYDETSLLPRTIRDLKKRFGSSLVLMSDVCLCPYTSHGHCGVMEQGKVSNDASLEYLSKMALLHAQCGVDIVAPSDMMDFRVKAIREKLDINGFTDTSILAYTAKYASSYYGPFRNALGSAPKAKSNSTSDRTTYQMDFRNRHEALRELALDIAEGADMVMVKPALAYLDIIRDFRETSSVPIAAYSVSSEYQMVKLLVEKGLAEEEKIVMENLYAIKRAGAQIIITYFADLIAEKGWMK